MATAQPSPAISKANGDSEPEEALAVEILAAGNDDGDAESLAVGGEVVAMVK